MHLTKNDPRIKKKIAKEIGDLAVEALIQEAKVTPKPGLVDCLDSGSHNDLTIKLMFDSANTLLDTFRRIALVSMNQNISQNLREDIAMIGRVGETSMFKTTKGVNTHKGAIWAIGLITSAYAVTFGKKDSYELLITAGKIARFEDRKYLNTEKTNGDLVFDKYGIKGARREAEEGFPAIYNYGLPTFQECLSNNMPMEQALLKTLLKLIMNVDDTCILHRSGFEGLEFAKLEAEKTLKNGCSRQDLLILNEKFKEKNISPGGSADLLAAIIFLHLLNQYTIKI